MPHKLLFVCAMNVCRSPLAAYTFIQATEKEGDRSAWTVSSRGTGVTARQPICEVSAELIRADADGQAFAKAHLSAPITGPQLMQQDLILVATTAERGRIAQLNPAVRDRLFTVREALLLGKEPVTASERDGLSSAGQRLRLGGYPMILHRRRGLVTIPPPKARVGLRKRVVIDPLDIPDVHHEKLRKHQSQLRELQGDVLAVHRQLKAFLESRA